MMLPGQIKNYQLSATKQGTYKASDVEAFRQKVYHAFCEVVAENNALKEKFVSLSDLVSEYNAGKNSIATALIKSQTLADETVKNAENKANEIISEAQNKADALYESKKASADEYYNTKIETADEYYERAKTELNNVLSSIKEKSDLYIADVNSKASQIIATANEQAAAVVSRAFADAQKAKETCDKILKDASLALPSVKCDVDEFKSQTLNLLSNITSIVESIDVPDNIDYEPQEIELPVAPTLNSSDIPAFEADTTAYEFSDDDNAHNEETYVEETAKESDEETDTLKDGNSSSDNDLSDYIFDKFSAFDDIFSSDE